MVLNYNASPVSISTRYSSEIVPAGDDHSPSSIPMSLDEIMYANNTGKAFKCGLLMFEDAYKEEIYEELRISNWREIMTNQDIYDIILNPTIEGLERIIAIDEPLYFDRVYGAYIGLKNAGADITTKVADVLKARRLELKNNKRKSAIELRAAKEEANAVSYDDMQKKLEEMQAMIEKLTAEKVAESVKDKPKTTKRSTSKKTSAEKPEAAEEKE